MFFKETGGVGGPTTNIYIDKRASTKKKLQSSRNKEEIKKIRSRQQITPDFGK